MFHEPRSDTPSPRRPDDVNANKSLYGNERQTPSIRCPKSAPGRRDAARSHVTHSAGMTTHRPKREGPGDPGLGGTSGSRATRGAEIRPLPTSIPGTEHGRETSDWRWVTLSRATARVLAPSPATRRERTDASQTPPIAHPAGRQERWQRPGQ